ncbi:MAG: metallophosphoesterase [Roseburia sp.]|nr:metallophosphoesterase [Roseburia sp.]
MLNFLLALLLMLIVALLWMMLYDTNRFVLVRHTFTDKRIRRDCRAVVLADLHNKRYGRDNELLIQAIRECAPDMILVAGDLLTAVPGRSPEAAVRLLQELKKDYPVYYANGNHEHRLKLYPKTYGNMAEEYEDALQKLGIERLVNTHVELE